MATMKKTMSGTTAKAKSSTKVKKAMMGAPMMKSGGKMTKKCAYGCK